MNKERKKKKERKKERKEERKNKDGEPNWNFHVWFSQPSEMLAELME